MNESLFYLLVIIAAVFAIALGIATIIMPLVVLLMHGQLSKIIRILNRRP